MATPPPMSLDWRHASNSDLGLLAEWNHQLIRDEGHSNPMSQEQLGERLKAWLESDYKAVIFSAVGPVAYALYRRHEDSIYLRQFFVARGHRRQGIGRQAFGILKGHVWPPDHRLTVDVLCSNTAAAAFYRSLGYRDYALTLEFTP